MKGLQSKIEREYGAGIAVCEPNAILWATETYAKEVGVKQAKAELSKVNKVRARHGAPLAYAPYGSVVF